MPSGRPKRPADKPLLAVLRGERRDPPPMWMMRQAGRYLPEYRRLRQERGGFLDLVYDPEAAAEVTLQPIERFPELDAAILFSDILIIPFALGQNLTFVTGDGPRLTPPLADRRFEELSACPARLDPIYETVRKVRERLSADKTLIGFAGSPWTVATYMVAGQGSRDQADARRIAYAEPERFGAIVARIEEMTLSYLMRQIEAGAEALQLFDSWAGSLSPAQFEQWVIAPTARIVAALREQSSGRAGDRLSQGRGRQAGRLCARDEGFGARTRRDRRSPLGRHRVAHRFAGAGQSRPPCAACRGRADEGGGRRHP